MNPAIDIATTTPRLVASDKMRCAAPRFDAGGGGVNVARTIVTLGEPATAVFPVGGHTGRLLEQLVRDAGVPARTVGTAGTTRENMAVTDAATGTQYRFVFPGMPLTPAEQQRVLDVVGESARGATYLVASGSLPPGVPADFYQQLADRSAEWGVRLVVDTSGNALRQLSSGVHLLKPSIRELREYIGRPLRERSEMLAAARLLITAGVARVVVVSLGAEGALAVTAAAANWFPAVPEPVISGIGAGDAMVGGLTVGLARGWDLETAVRLGIAAATAALGTPGTGPGNSDHIDELFARLRDGSEAAATRRPAVADREGGL
ncbi:1-phosphofructokinase family hexose kinase [Nocardia stercoris]|uniref:1-phosphofructokinase family hexose kinase n=2 Tax=Nocardia stercoris TaxID=2483361 RepID=A0A3M2LCK7_9NOCA|nr:1-phosphofructokinase family hexose kinase [Nocardia stercoris]